MPEPIDDRAADRDAGPHEPARLTGALALAFTLSGVAGLAYELVWTRYLALLVGHSAYAQVLVLAVYLGGTAVGSLLVADRSRSIARPLRAYALAEVGLGLFGLAFHPLYLGGQWVLYRGLAPSLESGAALGVASWAVAMLLVLPQAVLLGTTFPLMAAGLLRRAPHSAGRSVADVYLLNTIGGAAGVLATGFLLIPTLGLPGSALVAAALNFAAAALSGGRDAVRTPSAPTEQNAGPELVAETTQRVLVPLLLASTFVSALASFLYEIGWVRMLSLLLGSATHSFELMLSAFLLGLGFGSLLIRRWSDRARRPVWAIGMVQWVMGLAALLTLPLYQSGFPAMAWLVTNLPPTDGGYFLFNASRYGIALIVMLPATLLAGMTLPLIAATLLRRGGGERAIGLANGANTLGSVVGAVAGGLFVLPALGLEGILALGAGLDMAVGVALLTAAAGSRARAIRVGVVAGASAAALVFVVTATVGLDRMLLTSGVYRTGRLPPEDASDVVFYEDGATATVSAHRAQGGFTTLSTNGKPDASLPLRWLLRGSGAPFARAAISGDDESTQVYGPLVLLAHRSGARHAAVVGHGSGLSAQLLLGSSRLESLVSMEIEPAMILGSRAFFPANQRVFEDERSSFVLEDARTALAGRGEPLDLIFSEPSNPWVSGVASLFTEQFYERVRTRLAEGGVFGQWFHLYEMEDELLLSVLAALDRTFPDWSAWMVGSADVLVVAGKGELPEPDWSVLQETGIRDELSLAPLPTPAQMESLRLFDDETFAPLLAGRPSNTDYRPILDTRAERARFHRSFAAGLFSFADDPLDLPRTLARRAFAPVPYDSLPVTALPPLTRRGLAGWLITGEARLSAAPDQAWLQALLRETVFGTRMQRGDPPAGWPEWTRQFVDVETTRHGRAAGWIDVGLYGSVERFLEEQGAPDETRAAVALLKGVRSFDFASAAAAADRLRVTEGGGGALPPTLLLDASVAAYLGAERPDQARAAFEALAPSSGRSPGNARNLWLAALVGSDLR